MPESVCPLEAMESYEAGEVPNYSTRWQLMVYERVVLVIK